ncbi:LytTR family transcriptional regulator DNA-binding domain-containing protein [Cytobacillus purgationiresistens]|uniref:ABC-2 type transport system ATP-binding protein n=1 Tax=Cytobacillus purgationiresistens TaxID=863449 RepID=A0ABU0AS98_9BACI|nr:LytTR family transcriptional regulator DNA-binding domain-containing protein [Cytobacillus purgationiresistens]MDQ0272915.1 ABC-2 type transport system ATP-binding protein [Cytobacillus purgationiresistens]
MGILRISELEKHNEHTVVFPAFNLEVSEREVVAIHASTNVRTTLLNIIMGGASASNGVVYINNETIEKSRGTFLAKIGGFFLQDGLYERLSVKEHLSFYQSIYGSTLAVDEVIRMVQLEGKRNQRVGKLSFSEQRRIHFSRLLFQNPDFLIFEEPDQNIDLETKRIFLKLVRAIKEKGKAMLVLTGNMESALAITDTVYRLDDKGFHTLDIRAEDNEKDLAEEKSKDELGNDEVIVQPVRFEKIPTKVNEKIVLFDPPEIDYIESSDGQSLIFIKGESYPCMFTMTDLEIRLHPYGFFRCHRSYIVNLQKVREVVTWTRNSFTLVLTDDKKSSIPLSKTKMAELKGMLGLK